MIIIITITIVLQQVKAQSLNGRQERFGHPGERLTEFTRGYAGLDYVEGRGTSPS
jgi:hypothetical protein